MTDVPIWLIVTAVWVIAAAATAWTLLMPAHKAGVLERPECRLSTNPLHWLPFVAIAPLYWIFRLILLLFSPLFYLAAIYSSWSWNRNAVEAMVSDSGISLSSKRAQSRTIPWTQVRSWIVEFFPPFHRHRITLSDDTTEYVAFVSNWDKSVPATLAEKGILYRDETHLAEQEDESPSADASDGRSS